MVIMCTRHAHKAYAKLQLWMHTGREVGWQKWQDCMTMAGLFTNLQQGKILTDMQSKAAHSLHEEVSKSCEMMAIQEVFQAGLIHRSESVAKAQVHADDVQEAFLPAALSDILLLASGQIDWLGHPIMECKQL